MAKTIEIAQAIAEAGYLRPVEIENAAVLLANALSSDEPVQARATALSDEADQDRMIKGARAMSVQDAARGDKKGQQIDEAIIQDALNQEQVDESIIYHADESIAKTCKRAAADLASDGLIEKENQEAVASLIADLWTGETA